MTTDPLAALRQPTTPIAPSPEFAASLRARVEAALNDPHPPSQSDQPNPRSDTMSDLDTTTAPSAASVAEGSSPIVPYLIVAGAADAIDFYRAAFGAVEIMRLEMPDGRVGHAELEILGAEIALADEFPEYQNLGPGSLGG